MVAAFEVPVLMAGMAGKSTPLDTGGTSASGLSGKIPVNKQGSPQSWHWFILKLILEVTLTSYYTTAVSEEGVQAGKVNPFLRSWAWKRECKSDRERFDIPYEHKIVIQGRSSSLVLKQTRFHNTGFASTGYAVWDSAIVLSKYFEKQPHLIKRKRCVELGAGCGLAGMSTYPRLAVVQCLAAAALGASSVTLTDLAHNLPLLQYNCKTNSDVEGIANVAELEWQGSVLHLQPPFEVIIATDLMYLEEAVPPLIDCLCALSTQDTRIYLAYGRNRWAEAAFHKKISRLFKMERVANVKLDEVYQCIDVDVFVLSKL
eukprot:SM000139S00094  [mRNA]  locus=s139:156605:158127:+ [translate_table: standard]